MLGVDFQLSEILKFRPSFWGKKLSFRLRGSTWWGLSVEYLQKSSRLSGGLKNATFLGEGWFEKRLLVTARDDGFRNDGTNREHHDAYDAKRFRLLSRIIKSIVVNKTTSW